jgi:hypothetical protein
MFSSLKESLNTNIKISLRLRSSDSFADLGRLL